MVSTFFLVCHPLFFLPPFFLTERDRRKRKAFSMLPRGSRENKRERERREGGEYVGVRMPRRMKGIREKRGRREEKGTGSDNEGADYCLLTF